MAAQKGYIETSRQVSNILEDVRGGIFKCVYLLMGDEPYYPDLVCDAILENCLQDWETCKTINRILSPVYWSSCSLGDKKNNS